MELIYLFNFARLGLYQIKNHQLNNADVNGTCNIIQKVAPKAFYGLDKKNMTYYAY